MIPSCSNSNGIRRKAIKSDKKMYQRRTWKSRAPKAGWSVRRRRPSVDLEPTTAAPLPLYYAQIFGRYYRVLHNNLCRREGRSLALIGGANSEDNTFLYYWQLCVSLPAGLFQFHQKVPETILKKNVLFLFFFLISRWFDWLFFV